MKDLLLFFIPPAYKIDEDLFRKARLLVLTCFITPCFSLFYLATTVFYQLHLAFWAMLFNVFTFPFIPFLFRRGLSIVRCANIYTCIGFVGVLISAWSTGGIFSTVTPWLAMLPVVSLMLSNKKSGWVWTAVSYFSIVLFSAFVFTRFPVPNEMPVNFIGLYAFTNLSGLVLMIFIITLVFENTKNFALKRLDEKNKLIEEEKQRSDNLLLNILPAEVVEELKSTGKTPAKNYELATVLFADFVDFTFITEEMPPEELVSSIDDYFRMIDQVVTRYNVEKIKTVGDAYICAAGLGAPDIDNPSVMIMVALDIVATTKKMNGERLLENKTVFEMRIGVNSGPLVAGVVGDKKFAYDIWGDTVNTAARMQQHGEPGKINISGKTYQLVKDRFNCSYRGRLDAKHKGLVDMYYVDSEK